MDAEPSIRVALARLPKALPQSILPGPGFHPFFLEPRKVERTGCGNSQWQGRGGIGMGAGEISVSKKYFTYKNISLFSNWCEHSDYTCDHWCWAFLMPLQAQLKLLSNNLRSC
jgi:hypothetical protein